MGRQKESTLIEVHVIRVRASENLLYVFRQRSMLDKQRLHELRSQKLQLKSPSTVATCVHAVNAEVYYVGLSR